MRQLIEEIQQRFLDQSPEALLTFFCRQYPRRLALASSLGAEDQVLTDLLLRIEPKTRIFLLDTGRLPQETYDVMDATAKKYTLQYEVYFPEAAVVETMVERFGPNLFYESVENRKRCCEARKLQPLRRALKNLDVWVTGLRREQAVTRQSIEVVEWDEVNGLIKLNPLAGWTTNQVWDYIHTHQVPYNRLHDQGYPSIGCIPCTRAVANGEDIRTGRWWWEAPEHKECGLHYRGGKLVRRETS